MPSEALAKEGSPMRYVYLLQSEALVDQRYVGVTSDLRQRLADHNAGKSPHTSKYMPWKFGDLYRLL
jgi:predicted GIY-YIG superfamily endonuclease